MKTLKLAALVVPAAGIARVEAEITLACGAVVEVSVENGCRTIVLP